jgi:hypothetical protein
METGTTAAASLRVKLSAAGLALFVILLIGPLTGCASSSSSQTLGQDAQSTPAENTSETPQQWNPVECWIARETWWLPKSAEKTHGCQSN